MKTGITQMSNTKARPFPIRHPIQDLIPYPLDHILSRQYLLLTQDLNPYPHPYPQQFRHLCHLHPHPFLMNYPLASATQKPCQTSKSTLHFLLNSYPHLPPNTRQPHIIPHQNTHQNLTRRHLPQNIYQNWIITGL